MRDLTSATAIHAKGGLFLLLGMLAGAAVLVESPTWRTAVLLGVTVWASARFYYYAFYVVEHYVDATYRYSGLTSIVTYWIWRRRDAEARPDDRADRTAE